MCAQGGSGHSLLYDPDRLVMKTLPNGGLEEQYEARVARRFCEGPGEIPPGDSTG